MPKSNLKAKAKSLINQFFLLLLVVNLFDIEIIPNYLFSYHIEKITVYKIRPTMLKPISQKALGENDISNLILKFFIDFLLPHLYQIFNKCLDTRFYLIYF